jgi:hypothetical protein
VSKGHHAHRRKSYGRRQHDLRERTTRRQPDGSQFDLENEAAATDGYAFADDRHRVQIALGG